MDRLPAYLDGLSEASNRVLRAAFEEGRLLQLEGYQAQSAEKHRDAIDRFTRALELAENDSQRAALHNLRGNSYNSLTEWAKAEADYQETLELAERISPTRDAAQASAVALGNLGVVYGDRGELLKAEDHHKQALEIDRRMGNRPGEARDLGNLGLVYIRRGGPANLEVAEEYLKQALDIDREIGNRPGEAIDLDNLGLVYFQRGELEKATDCLQRAQAIYEAIDAGGEGPETVRRALEAIAELERQREERGEGDSGSEG